MTVTTIPEAQPGDPSAGNPLAGIEIRALPAFNDNYIWLMRRAGWAAVVDPGDASPVLDFLDRSGDRLCAILITHHHADHIGGIDEILARLASANALPVFGPALEKIESVNHPLTGGEHIRVPELGLALDVIAVPGHTLNHIAYYGASIGRADTPTTASGALFCGDTLFAAGCGRLFEGTPAQMLASLTRLGGLPPSTLIYCAHEYTQSNLRFARAVEPDNRPIQQRADEVAAMRAAGKATVPTQLAVELETNPFLRCGQPTVRAAAAMRLGHAPADTLEAFTAIRQWKNGF